jgi:hypothetical protein
VTPHQLLSARLAETPRAALAAEIGISDRELKDFMAGITLPTMAGSRLSAWLTRQLPASSHTTDFNVLRPGTNTRDEDEEDTPTPRERRDSGWAFVREASPIRSDLARDEGPYVPRSTLHAYYTAEVERVGSWRAVARAVGISTVSMQRFVAQPAHSNQRVLRPLKRLYLTRGGLNSDPKPARPAKPVRQRVPKGVDDPPDAPWRSVPLDTLRGYVAAEATQLRSNDRAARMMGVGGRALRSFLAGEARTRLINIRALALYYLQQDGKLSEPPARAPRPPRPRTDPPAWLEPFRTFVRDRLDECTIPELLSEIGPPVSDAVLRNCLEGRTPKAPALARLESWYEHAAAEAGDKPRAAWRGVDEETLRTYFAEEVQRVRSRCAVARAAGITTTRLRRFLAGETVTPLQVRRALALLYTSRDGRLSDPKSGRRAALRPEWESDAPWRKVPAETLRTYFSAESRQLGSVGAAALAAGVSRNALRSFLDEKTRTRPRVVRALAVYYLAKDGTLSEPPPRPPRHDDVEDEQDAPWRTIALDTLRTYFRAECRQLGSEAAAAGAAEVTTYGLRRFLTDPGPVRMRVVRQLALYYLARSGQLSPSRRREPRPQRSVVPPGVDIPGIREFIRDRAEDTSIEDVAGEIGPPLTHRGLVRFTKYGAQLPDGELLHLAAWHERALRETGIPAWRAVDVRAVRAYFAAEVEIFGARSPVARTAGVSPHSLAKFLGAAVATPRSILRRLALRYLSVNGRVTDPQAVRRGGARDVDVIRRAAQERIAQTSVNAVLREIGPPLTRASFDRFLTGSVPVEGSLAQLRAWHGRIVEEPPTDDTWRQLPVTLLRGYYAEEVNRVGSKEAVARSAGISPSSLHRFLTGETVAPPALRPLALLYLAREGRLSDARRVRTSRAEAANGPTDDGDAPWRRIPVEVLRRYIAAECAAHRSQPAVARAAGVSKKGLQHFLDGTTTSRPWVQRAFAEYYLRNDGKPTATPGTGGSPARRRPAPPRAGSYPFFFPAAEIHTYLLHRAELSSLSVVLSEINGEEGIARATVEGFLDGSALLTESSAKRLLAWYLRAFARLPMVDGAAPPSRVPLDELRRFYLQAAAGASASWVAGKACVGVQALERLLARAGRLQPRTLLNLTLYYHSRRGCPETPVAPPTGIEEPMRASIGPTAGNSPAPGASSPGAAVVPTEAPFAGQADVVPTDIALADRRHATPVTAPPDPLDLPPEQQRINTIRAYARLRGAAMTNRVVADDAGVIWASFYAFLRGADPNPENRARLEAWYARDSATDVGAATLREQLVDAGSPQSSIPALRAFCAAVVQKGTASVPSVAHEAQVSPAALHRFIDGGDAGQETIVALRAFYADFVMKKLAAVDAILEDLDGEVRTRARRRMLSGLARGYKEAGLPTAGWVEFLIAQRV